MLVPHFGLDGEPALTLADIGIELGISRERAPQLKDAIVQSARQQLGVGLRL